MTVTPITSPFEAINEALRRLDEAAANQSLVAMEVGQSLAAREAAVEVQRIEAAMQTSTLHITIEAVERGRWAKHCAENPPRDGDETDESWGVDVSSFDPLIQYSIVGVKDSAGEPVPFGADDWPSLSESLSDGQWTQFAEAVLLVNRGVAAPKSKAASLVMRHSEPTSN